jgi:hypothetical protein
MGDGGSGQPRRPAGGGGLRVADGRHLAAEHLPAPADERESGLRPVECERCGACVLVAKFSPQHTSVQWSMESVYACAEFSARTAAGEQTALIAGCASMRASIDRAVLEGRLEVSPP